MDLKKQPALWLSVIAGIATAVSSAGAVATATGNVTVASVVAALGVAIPSVAGILIRAGVVPVARVEEALGRINDATSTADASVKAVRELEALTRAEIARAWLGPTIRR